MSEDKIDLSKNSIRYRYDPKAVDIGIYFEAADVLGCIAEIYKQAYQIGWETKCLDALTDKIINTKHQIEKLNATP